MDELGFSYAYTPVYSPAFNGIEEVFSQAKHAIKKSRLEKLLNEEEVNIRRIIEDAFYNLEPHNIAKCVSRSLEMLKLD